MARALPFRANPFPHISIDLVIAVPTVANPFRPYCTVAAQFAFCLLAGCSTDARETPRRAAAATKDALPATRSSGDVVIAPSTTPYVATDVASPGSVTGTVRLASPLAIVPPLPTNGDSVLCGASMPDESVREKSGGLEGVVVWLDGVRRGKRIPLERRIELESDKCRLTPRVQTVVVGSAVNIIAHDYLRQHLHFATLDDATARAAILLGGGEQVIPTELPFTSPGLVAVRDVDHAWPRAFIAVFDHPYFAVTSASGTFTIDSVPPGTYTLHVWHERTKAVTHTVHVGTAAAAQLELSLVGK